MRRVLFFAAIFACNADTFTDDAGVDAEPDVIVGGGGDGSSDGGPVKDVVAPRFCQTVDAQFCADFDIPDDAGAGFVQSTMGGGYTFDFEGAKTKSSPFALRATPATDAGGEADLVSVFPLDAGITTKATLELDIYLPAYDGGYTQSSLFAFTLGILASQFQFGLVHDHNFWRLEDRLSQTGPALSSDLPEDQWVHASLEIVLSANTSGSVFLAVGSATASITGILTMPSVPLPLSLTVGVRSDYAPQTPGAFLYDNVELHWQ
jgi:hypothetical protein